MKALSAKDTKYGFGRLIDLARAGPVAVTKHARPVVVVMAVEECKRMAGLPEEVDEPEPFDEVDALEGGGEEVAEADLDAALEEATA